MPSSAETLSQGRQVHIAVRAAPETHTLAAQIEQRDNRLMLAIIQSCGDFAAVAEAAGGSQLDSALELAIEGGQACELDALLERFLG